MEVPSNLNEREIGILKQFRENVADVLTQEDDNYFLAKWLRARQFDLQKAEDMIRKSMEWRKSWGADTILKEWSCPEVINKYDIGGICGFDKEGCPVWVYTSANLDMKGISLSVKRSEYIKRYVWKMEENRRIMKEQSQKLGKRIDKVIMIDDLEGYTMKHIFQPGMDSILKILGYIEGNYPESLKACYVINAPTIFPLIFRIVKPFMSEDTRNKITILGSNWKEELLKVIDADQLPVHWGGTKVDPQKGDEYCSTLVRVGGKVPSSYNLKGSDLVDESKVTTVRVCHGQVITVQCKVKKSDVMIRYTFWTHNHDVKFEISFKDSEHSKEENVLKPNKKVSCHLIPEDATVECSKPGIYLFKFDNSYSWFHSKDVSYVIEVLDPDVISKDASQTSDHSATISVHESTSVYMEGQNSLDGTNTGAAEKMAVNTDCVKTNNDNTGDNVCDNIQHGEVVSNIQGEL